MRPKSLVQWFQSFLFSHSIYHLVLVPWVLGFCIIAFGWVIALAFPTDTWIPFLGIAGGFLCMSLSAIPEIIKREAILSGVGIVKGREAVFVAIVMTVILWVLAAVALGMALDQ